MHPPNCKGLGAAVRFGSALDLVDCVIRYLLAALRMLRLDALRHNGSGQAGARRAALPARAPHDGPPGARAGRAAAQPGRRLPARRRRARATNLITKRDV